MFRFILVCSVFFTFAACVQCEELDPEEDLIESITCWHDNGYRRYLDIQYFDSEHLEELLSQYTSEEAFVDQLLKMCRSKNMEYQDLALNFLEVHISKFNLTSSQWETLFQWARSSKEFLSTKSIRILGNSLNKNCIPLLLSRLKKTKPEITAAALEALGKLKSFLTKEDIQVISLCLKDTREFNYFVLADVCIPTPINVFTAQQLAEIGNKAAFVHKDILDTFWNISELKKYNESSFCSLLFELKEKDMPLREFKDRLLNTGIEPKNIDELLLMDFQGKMTAACSLIQLDPQNKLYQLLFLDCICVRVPAQNSQHYNLKIHPNISLVKDNIDLSAIYLYTTLKNRELLWSAEDNNSY